MVIDTKSIFASKTLWVNVAGLLLTVSGVIPAPYRAIVAAIANVITRFYTTQPVTIMGGPTVTDQPIISGPPSGG